jgi:YwiC-like protein
MTSDPNFLVPREHGAYGQLAFPLLTSFIVAGVSITALLIGASLIAAFLAHEPLLVLLGRRGARVKRDQRRQAIVALVVTGTLAALAGVSALVRASSDVRWSLLLPLVPAAVLSIALVFEREKRAIGEVAVALTFSLAAAPLCVAAGSPLRTGLSVGLAFAAIFVSATLAVRVVILRVRGGGNPRAERATRVAVWMVSASWIAMLGWATARGAIHAGALAASAPGLAGAVWLSLRPPSPTQLRTVGWTLVAAAGTATVILIVTLW